ncbi:MAG: hypothetical protein ACXW3G_04465 [Rhodoplanes sp.]
MKILAPLDVQAVLHPNFGDDLGQVVMQVLVEPVAQSRSGVVVFRAEQPFGV